MKPALVEISNGDFVVVRQFGDRYEVQPVLKVTPSLFFSKAGDRIQRSRVVFSCANFLVAERLHIALTRSAETFLHERTELARARVARDSALIEEAKHGC